ncbi:MAG: ABC transporter permease [Terriglobia bacterium]
MPLFVKARSLLRNLFLTRRVEADLDQEVHSHLEMLIEEKIRAGMSPEEARRDARIELGGVDQVKERVRDARMGAFFDSLLQDIHYGLRTLRKSPGFAVIAVLTLALGIGANTAIFSVVYAVVLRPLPYTHPEQLISVLQAKPQESIRGTGCSFPDFTEWREQNLVFSELAGAEGHELTLTGHGDPSVVTTMVVTPELFSLLDAKPLAGRTFLSEDGQKGAAPVVIVSENLWRGRFGADPNIVGSSISLDKRPFTVVGVMPAEFSLRLITQTQDIWIPLVQDPLFGPWMSRRGQHWLPVIGRLKPGVSLAQAQAEMDTISARLAKEFPAEDAGWTIQLAPLQTAIVGDMRSALFVLLGAVGLLLLIACANIANMLLTRATSRAREMAIRTALGAGRARIVRQLLTECAVLGLLGGGAGICLAYWGVSVLTTMLPQNLPRFHPVRVDSGVLVFALLLSVAAGFLFGLAPALYSADFNVQENLKQASGRSGEGSKRRGFLAGAEIALATVLLVAAGLLIRSFASLTSVSPGFNVQHMVKADVSLPQFEYSTPQQWTSFSNELLDRIQAEPGLRDTALAVPLPLVSGVVNLGFDIVGNPPLTAGTSRKADYVAVSPEYFRVMGIPLLRGRDFAVQDSLTAPRVALISEAFAHFYFPNQDPIGKQLIFGFPPGPGAQRVIVGVVGDVRDVSLSQEPGPIMYVPFAQAPFWGSEIVVKSSLAPSAVAAAIRKDVAKIDKDLPVTDVSSMPEILDASVGQPRFRTVLLGLFAALALGLAAAGIFGVISYSVSRRMHELGIRIALGATPTSVLRLILRESAKIILIGLAVGIPVALGLARFLSSLLFAVHSADPLTFIAVPVLLALVALAASYVPTRRAMRVDPMVALRDE